MAPVKAIRQTLLFNKAICLRNTNLTQGEAWDVTLQIVSPGLDMALLVGLMACSAMSMVYTMPPTKVGPAVLQKSLNYKCMRAWLE